MIMKYNFKEINELIKILNRNNTQKNRYSDGVRKSNRYDSGQAIHALSFEFSF